MNILDLLRPTLIDTFFNRKGAGAIQQAEVPALIEAALSRAKADPVIQNEVNAENPLRSRVVTGSSASLLMAGALLLDQWNNGTFNLTDQETLISLGIVLTAAYALYGRLRSGLAPMWTRILSVFKR